MAAEWLAISTSSFCNLRASMSELIDLAREVIVISSDEEEVKAMPIRSRGTKRGLDRSLVEEDLERTARAKRFRIGTRCCSKAKVISSRRVSRSSDGSLSKKGSARRDSIEAEYEIRWLHDLRHLEALSPSHFTSCEARMQVRSALRPGECAYLGIGATMQNCLGLRRVYNVYFRPRETRVGCESAILDQTITTVSQFLRWAVSSSFCCKEEIWKEETLFESVADEDLVVSFLHYFMERCSPGTARIKAICLKRVCSVAMVSVRDIRQGGQLELVAFILRNMANSSKQAHRMVCQKKKSVEKRLTSGSVISLRDYVLATRIGRVALDYMMKKAQRKGCGTYNLISHLDLKRWCRNLTGFLMLNAGGQRPQVFSQLQVPSEAELRIFSNMRSAYIELRTMDEKRPRHMTLPQVVFPASVLPYLQFHVEYVRPLIERVTGVKWSGSVRPLLLHPRTGKSLNPESVTGVLHAFLSSHNAKLTKVTAMNLRSSYASMMMELHNRRKVFAHLPETHFLDTLAQQMNTSPEQLRRTYVAHDSSKLTPDLVDLVKFWNNCLTGQEPR